LSIFDPNTLLPRRAGIAGLALVLSTLEIDDATTAAFTVAGGSPITTGLQNINKYYTGLVFSNGAFSRGNDTVAYRIRNAFVDAFIRYDYQPTAGYTMYSINGNQSNSSTRSILRNPGAPTGYIRYVYAPNNPSNLRATSSTTTSIDLAWNAPSNNGETSITGYRLERSTVSDFSSSVTVTNLTNVTSRTVSSLSGGVTYYFRIAAKNAVTDVQSTWSAYSNTLTKLATPSIPTLSVSRTGLTYTVSGSSSITDGAISSYRFSSRSSTNGGSTFTDWSSDTTLVGTTYSTTFVSSAATTYQFRVRARSADAVFSDYNSSGNFHTPNVPLIPVAAISLSKNVRKVTVDWDAFRTSSNSNAVYNGAVISSYQVEARYSNDNGATWVISYANIGTTTASTTLLITGDLLIAKTYQFRVRAVSDVGNSAYQESPIIFISAYGQRRNSVPQSDTVNRKFDPIETARRFDGTSWQTVLMAKRFNGTSWVDLTN
jgi:hypothetical protein